MRIHHLRLRIGKDAMAYYDPAELVKERHRSEKLYFNMRIM